MVRLASEQTARPDSVLRARVSRFAQTWRALLLVLVWAFAEALSWPLVPELLLAVLVVATPRSWLRLGAAAVFGSVLGGLVGFQLTMAHIELPQPLTTAG